MIIETKPSNILGIMSGTSLDGLDMAFCSFSRSRSGWNYKVVRAVTIPYPPELYTSLKNSIYLNGEELSCLDHDYGKWIGKECLKFLDGNKLEAQWISSHGHTVFHQPLKGFTLQIGNGNDIAAQTGIPVICDFRTLDVALGGQGAPLVPAGEEYLFGMYDYCLNLGGFSNISYNIENHRIAFDICPVNMGLNFLCGKMGFQYDENGNSGRLGHVIHGMLNKLNNLSYYRQKPPKSLGREWFINQIEPIINQETEVNDVLRTFYEHISYQICSVLKNKGGKKVLVTGGGAKNEFLVDLITKSTDCEIVIPDAMLIDFKEAIIFAFLGYLRINNIPNTFSSVTGALRDSCGGMVIVI
jgi:anhydro-N-acetylmuramic acid kinase